MVLAFSVNNLIPKRYISYAKFRTWYANLVKPKPQDPPYRHVVQIGDPILRVPCEAIPQDMIKSSEVRFLIYQLKAVFDKYNCVGLSAPQIGMPFQVAVIEFNKKHAKCFSQDEFRNKDMSILQRTVMINPQMKIVDYTKLIYPESCESIKGFWADVPRYKAVQIDGFNEDGEPLLLKANGWSARIIQHEMDHLTGRLYTDIMDRKSLTCCCWEVVNERSGRVRVPLGPD